MSEDLKKAVLVTGAKGALGKAVVDRFAKTGAVVIGTDIEVSSGPAQQDFLQDADQSNLYWTKSNLTNIESVKNLKKKVSNGGFEIEKIVHCAGGFRFQMIDETSDEDISFLVDLNLKSSIYLLREFLPSMKEKKFGRFTVISAAALSSSPAGMSVYLASKAGLIPLIESVQKEVEDLDVNLNAILPTIYQYPCQSRGDARGRFF